MARRLLSPSDREIMDAYAIRRWLNSKHFRRAKANYYDTLEILGERIGSRAEDGTPLEYPIAEAFSTVLANDRSMAGFIRQKVHGSTALQEEDTWKRIFRVAALAVVEKWLRDRDGDALPMASVLTREELTSEIQSLLALAVERGQLAQGLATEAQDVILEAPHVPDMVAAAGEELERLLEQEALVALTSEGEADIPVSERNREVAKRALANLRITELRELAAREGVSPSGTFERIAERLVSKYHADEEAIARLVLESEEPSPETGILTRLIPLMEEPDVDSAAERFDRFVGRYVKVHIARWFVFTALDSSETALRIEGLLRYYRVEPKSEYEQYSLAATPKAADVLMKLHGDRKWAEVTVTKGSDARSIAVALRRAGGIRTSAGLAIPAHAPPGPMVQWDVRTVFMLDFLNSTLNSPPFRVVNLRLAQFETPPSGSGTPDPNRPSVTSVRLQGQHLLSSRQACEMIVWGRGLLSLTMAVRYQPDPNNSYYMPLRIELGTDHASVFTGFVEDVPATITREVHQTALDRLRFALEGTIQNQAALTALAGQIQARAQQQEPVETADILAMVQEPETTQEESAS